MRQPDTTTSRIPDITNAIAGWFARTRQQLAKENFCFMRHPFDCQLGHQILFAGQSKVVKVLIDRTIAPVVKKTTFSAISTTSTLYFLPVFPPEAAQCAGFQTIEEDS